MQVQKRLFDRLGELLKIRVAVHNLAELLTEVQPVLFEKVDFILLFLQIFAAGPETCLKVREEHVETIFVLIVERNSAASTQAQLMTALQALVKVSLY